MPLPLGHAAAGLAAGELAGKKDIIMNWKYYAFVAFLANLPDFDVFFGLLFHGNGNLFHRGLTHSLFFAVVMALPVAYSWKLWSKIPRINYWTAFLAIFSHPAADLIFTHSPVSLFWPFEVYIPSHSRGWLEVLKTVLFEPYRDALVIAVSVALFFLIRWLKHYRPLHNRTIGSRNIKPEVE